MVIAFISIGSNLGDKINNCKRAVELLGTEDGVKVIKVSSLYNTEPWGGIEQDWFINCVAQIETSLDVYNLLKTTRLIEGLLGRRKGDKGKGQGSGRRYLPRAIDLDILFYNRLVLETDGLIIPHPLLHKRRFVLTPLAEIAPDLIHPVLKRSVADLLRELEDNRRCIKIQDSKLTGYQADKP